MITLFMVTATSFGPPIVTTGSGIAPTSADVTLFRQMEGRCNTEMIDDTFMKVGQTSETGVSDDNTHTTIEATAIAITITTIMPPPPRTTTTIVAEIALAVEAATKQISYRNEDSRNSFEPGLQPAWNASYLPTYAHCHSLAFSKLIDVFIRRFHLLMFLHDRLYESLSSVSLCSPMRRSVRFERMPIKKHSSLTPGLGNVSKPKEKDGSSRPWNERRDLA